MRLSSTVLLIAVALVGALFVNGVMGSAMRAYPGDRARVKKLSTLALGLFFAVTFVELGLGASGVFSNFEKFPPPFAVLFLTMLGFPVLLAFSPLGTLLARGLSFATLTGFQAFRILAELTIYLGVKEGIAPVQLSVEGYNFDIVTGLSAAFLGLYLRKNRNLLAVRIFNFMGLGFLAVIAFIALTSMPTPLRRFMNEPSNIWVTGAPYILLPMILVVAALSAHLISLRKLRMEK